MKTYEQYRDEALAVIRQQLGDCQGLKPGGSLYNLACLEAEDMIALQTKLQVVGDIHQIAASEIAA